MTTVPIEINAAAAKSSATEKHTPMMQQYLRATFLPRLSRETATKAARQSPANPLRAFPAPATLRITRCRADDELSWFSVAPSPTLC